MNKSISFLIYIFALLSSCQNVIQLDLPDIDVKPVVNCLFTSGEPIQINLSLTKSANDTNTYFIDNADVVISHLQKEYLLTYTDRGNYSNSGLIPQNGQTYSIKIHTPEFEPITASDMIPNFGIMVKEYSYNKNIGCDEEGDSYSELMLKIKDIDPEPNYYGIAMFKHEKNKPYYVGLTSNDPKISSEIIATDYPGILAFRDNQFNETETIVSIKTSHDDLTHFKIFTFSEAAFNCIKTSIIHDYTKEYDFWEAYEPIPMYNNIENGYGIFAGYSSQVLEIKPETSVIINE